MLLKKIHIPPFFVLLFFTLLLFSCQESNDKKDPTSTTRNFKASKIKNQTYHYTSLATFEKGKANLNLEDLTMLTEKKVNILVIHESKAPWLSNIINGEYQTPADDDKIGNLIVLNSLTISQQFDIDDKTKGMVLESEMIQNNPLQIAKELSNIDMVLLVHLKEVPNNENQVEATN